MRTILLALVLVTAAGCRSSSLPGDGDGGVGDMAGGGGSGGGGTQVCTVFCSMGFTCCSNACVNLRNDIHNCGACGVTCTAPNDFCDGQKCVPPPCSPPCGAGTLCCDVQGPGPSRGPMCTAPTTSGTCPLGCPLCL
ncbi:MAG TPA: hypothetical protein VF997_21490 [Polyangia bacterium]